MKINNIVVSHIEFQNALETLKDILVYNERGIETTWPRIVCDAWDVYMRYSVNVNAGIYGYKEETRLRDNKAITCGYGKGCFWTSYPEE